MNLKDLQKWCDDNLINITKENYVEIIEKYLNVNSVFSNKIDKALSELLMDLNYSEFILCGSSSLKFFGLIDREIHDIDIITFKDYSGDDKIFKNIKFKAGSGSFEVDGCTVTSFAATLLNDDVKLNVFYKFNKTKYITIKFNNSYLNIELPFGAINAKLGYIDNDLDDETKHINDLKVIEKQLSNLVDKIHKNVPRIKTVVNDDIPF